MYYEGKIDTLRALFGNPDLVLHEKTLQVGNKHYPIVDDVIILLDPQQYPLSLRARLRVDCADQTEGLPDFAQDIQYTFGEEWKTYNEVLPEHEKEFREYFELVDLNALHGSRVCDIGCGIGRWAHFLKDHVDELVLLDFSEAIFEARKNLAQSGNALFFMADIKRLPFVRNCFDFAYCLGVLHHLPAPALDEVRGLAKYAPTLLIYLYYALDNRPLYYRLLLRMATAMRNKLARVHDRTLRAVLTELLTWLVYMPLIALGHVCSLAGFGDRVPLYEGYHGKGLQRIRQDVYDRFFTRIEQRVSRAEINALRDTFTTVTISDGLPYWHFLCGR
jgi:SAM-dependent methyltransferase